MRASHLPNESTPDAATPLYPLCDLSHQIPTHLRERRRQSEGGERERGEERDYLLNGHVPDITGKVRLCIVSCPCHYIDPTLAGYPWQHLCTQPTYAAQALSMGLATGSATPEAFRCHIADGGASGAAIQLQLTHSIFLAVQAQVCLHAVTAKRLQVKSKGVDLLGLTETAVSCRDSSSGR